VNLEHDLANCTGRWRPEAIGNRLRVRCDRCGSITHRSDAVDEAAALENQLGTHRRILPGFPRSDTFTSAEEVWNYFADEQITCLLCGRQLRRLAWHLPSIHGVSEDEYCNRYGLPLTYGLVGQGAFRAYSARSKKQIAEGRIDANGLKNYAAIGSAASQRERRQPYRSTVKKALRQGYRPRGGSAGSRIRARESP
jgi:predicted transcriptional regulator